jgi:hypothetical protein
VFIIGIAYSHFTTKADAALLFTHLPTISFVQKIKLLKRFYIISRKVECPHAEFEVLAGVKSILTIPEDVKGCIVEA